MLGGNMCRLRNRGDRRCEDSIIGVHKVFLSRMGPTPRQGNVSFRRPFDTINAYYGREGPDNMEGS